MSDEIAQAFGHPSERAKALAGDPPRDRIAMTEHRREVEIGAFQAERGITQTVQFDVVVEVETRAEQAVDDVDRILSYDTIVEAIDAALAEERVNLLETLASRIAERILRHPLAARCIVRIGKLDRGPYVLGVEILRNAPETRRRLRLLPGDAPHPRIVYLSAEAIARPDLPELLDRLEEGGAPLILCVGRPRYARAARGPCHAAAPDRPAGHRAIGLGSGPRAIRAASSSTAGPSLTGRCVTARSASGPPPSWCSTPMTGRAPRSAIRSPSHCGWPGLRGGGGAGPSVRPAGPWPQRASPQHACRVGCAAGSLRQGKAHQARVVDHPLLGEARLLEDAQRCGMTGRDDGEKTGPPLSVVTAWSRAAWTNSLASP